MIPEERPWGYIPEKKGKPTPRQKVKVNRWYLKRKNAAAWKKKKRMSKATKQARKRNRGK